MVRTTDVFVIGGGPAGLAAAIASRMRGLGVIVADGAQPPVDKACGEGLMPETLAALHKLGIRLNGPDGVALRGIRFLDRELRVEADFPSGYGFGIRRTVLHQKMIERAHQVGVITLWKTPVTALGREAVHAGGETIAARWVIGADGITSRARRWARLERGQNQRVRYAWRRHYSLEPWSHSIEIYWSGNAQAYVTPVAAQEICVVLISRHPGTSFASLHPEFPQLAERLSRATAADRPRGAVTTSFRCRVSTDRVALVGDASGSVDAITGDGLCVSFLQAQALADALEAGDLQQYEKAHRRLMRRPMLMSQLLLLLDRYPGLRRAAMSEMAADPGIFARFLSVHAGHRSPSDLAITSALLGWRVLAA